MTRTIIVDPSPSLRSWIAAGLQCRPGEVTEAESGWEILWHLAEREFDLVVTGTRIPDIPALGLLAMVRTAGLPIPFLMIVPFGGPSVRAIGRRLAPAEIVEDWTDTVALRASRDRLCRRPISEGDRALPAAPVTHERALRVRRTSHG